MTNNYFFRYKHSQNSLFTKGTTSSYDVHTFVCVDVHTSVCITVIDSTGYKFYPDMVIRPNILDILKTNRWEI